MNDKKRKAIEDLNKRLLGESNSTIKESHEDSDEGKISYITQALNNLSSEDLDKIYLSVEGYDPEYKPNIAKGNYRQASEPGKPVGRSEKDMFGGF